MTAGKPPKTLSTEARALWRAINRDFKLDQAGLLLLKTALEQYDIYIIARAQIEKDGVTTPTRNGLKTHPAVGAMKTSRDGFLAAWKLLGVGVETKDVGRPTDERELKWQNRLRAVK